jgi:drug/metabolite transporter (DMT)-like permease
MQEVRELHLELGSTLDSADAAELIVQRLAEEYGFSAEQIEHLGMAARMTLSGIWFWEPMALSDYGLMAALCVTGVSGHWLLIRCYEVAEASAVQPFAYLQLVFASIIGITVFGETLKSNVAIGVAIVVAAGVFTLWREQRRTRKISLP